MEIRRPHSERTRAFVRRDAVATFRRLLPMLSPRFDPADRSEPCFLQAVLDRAVAA